MTDYPLSTGTRVLAAGQAQLGKEVEAGAKLQADAWFDVLTAVGDLANRLDQVEAKLDAILAALAK